MALTKVTGQVINTTTDVTVGVLTVTNTLAVGGTVSIGGTLTYEDVTNVDSVGLITARNGINVGSGITLSKDGDGFFTGIVTATFAGDGTNLTGVASTDNIRSNTNATFLQNINVSGTSTVGGDVNIADKIVHIGDTNTAIRFPTADTFSVETGGSERLRIVSDGYVGINTTVTTHSLTVRRNGNSGGVRITNDHTTTTVSGNTASTAFPHALLLCNYQGNSTNTNNTNLAALGFDISTETANANALIVSQAESAAGNSNIQFWTEDTNTIGERLRITASGKILIGNNASESVYGLHHQLQVEGTNGATSSASFTRNSNDANPPYLTLAKTRGTSDGAETIVQDDDKVGVISFNAADGTNKDHMVAQIESAIDGTPGANDLPGRLVFSTTADGANSSTERLRITSEGKFGFNDSDPERTIDVKGANCMIQLEGTGGNGKQWSLCSTDDTTGSTVDGGPSGTFSIFNDSTSSAKLRIDSDGNVTKPSHCVFKSGLTNSFGSDGSLTTNTANCGILQASAVINRGSHYTTSGDNAYTFVCPVAGIYRIDMALSFGGSQSGRKIYVMSYTSGGGNLPLGSYNELMDLNPDDYQNVTYSAIWEFTAGTRIGVGKNGGSGTITGEHMEWAVTLVA